VSLELTNWAGNLAYRADSVHSPTSVVEVQELVARRPRVKALGTRHSFNTIADSPGGALISLSELAPDITIDAEAMTVSVTGGTRYGVLAAELQSQGYALHNTGSLPHISVAGATATGTHGSGDRNGILSTAVSAVELVKADGSLVTVDRSNPELKALAVGLGAFGVITRVVLDIQPTYLVRQDVYRNALWDTVLDAFDEAHGRNGCRTSAWTRRRRPAVTSSPTPTPPRLTLRPGDGCSCRPPIIPCWRRSTCTAPTTSATPSRPGWRTPASRPGSSTS
jgi:alditol oxidase